MALQGLSKDEVLESTGAILEGEASKVETTDNDFTPCAHHLRSAPGIYKPCPEPRAEAGNSIFCLCHAASGEQMY